MLNTNALHCSNHLLEKQGLVGLVGVLVALELNVFFHRLGLLASQAGQFCPAIARLSYFTCALTIVSLMDERGGLLLGDPPGVS